MDTKRKTALLASEAGNGFGHVKRLNSIAAGLRSRGWRTVLAPYRISSVDRANYSFDDVVPAPGWPRFQQESWFESGSEEDMLVNSYAVVGADFGLADPRVLTNIIQAWDSLMNLISPSVAVGDFAPGAMIAAHGRCPAIAVGTGFTVPAVVNGRFLPFQEKRGTDFPMQDRVKAAVVEAKKRAGHAIPDDPLIAVRGEIPFPVCYESFDVARGRRIEPVLSPGISYGAEPPARPPAGVGAYFGPDIKRYAHLLPLFGKLRPKPAIALEGSGPSIRKAAGRAGLMTRDSLFSAQDIVRGCKVFLHHGGLGTSQLCAVLGVPQLIIFCDTEKWMNAEAVSEQGAGIGIPLPVADKANVEGALSALLNEPRYKEAALAWSRKLQEERGAVSAVTTICDAVCGAV